MNIDYLKDSLFDKEAVENKGKKRDYKQGVDHHLTIFSGTVVADNHNNNHNNNNIKIIIIIIIHDVHNILYEVIKCSVISDEKLLERCPAFVMDYVYYVELPDDVTPERLLELGSNFEYRCLKNSITLHIYGKYKKEKVFIINLSFIAIFRNAGW